MKRKIKAILQHDVRDCGAACLSMIAGYYGLKMTMAKVRELTKTDRAGTNIYGLVDGGNQIGFESNALGGSPEELMDSLEKEEFHFPFVAHIINSQGMMHFIVVYGKKNGKWLIADPGKGKMKMSDKQFFNCWTGNIVTYDLTDKFKPANERRGTFIRFFALLHGQVGKLVGVLVLSLITAGIGIAGTFVFKLVIDNFAVSQGSATSTSATTISTAVSGLMETGLDNLAAQFSLTRFSVIFVAIIALYIFSAVIQVIRSYLIMTVSRKIDIELSLRYYRHLMDLPMSSLALRQTGEYLSRFSDTSSIRSLISGATLTIILDTVMAVGCGIVLYLENPKLFLTSLIMLALDSIVVLIYRKPVEKGNRELMENGAVVQSYFKESIDGAATIKAACANYEVKEKGSAKFLTLIQSSFKFGLLSLSQDVVASTIEMIGTVLILWVGFKMVLAGTVTVGALMTFYALLSYFTGPIKNLLALQPAVQQALVAADRLSDVLDLAAEQCSDEPDPIETVETYEFKDINFRYGNRELTLKDMSFSFKKGDKIAFVGESGSGKTTITKLLLHFYEPETGAVYLNGKPLSEFDPAGLRRSFSYIDQNTFLFADTVTNNLKLGRQSATEEEIKNACIMSRADDFIRDLPLGYETPIDENGSNLSGGQRQRLAIARALLKDPQLLIMDEAASNLDAVTETAIRDAVFALDKTCILIAHRLATVKKCDQIYVIDKGCIIEHGTHEELLAKGGHYAELWSRQ